MNTSEGMMLMLRPLFRLAHNIYFLRFIRRNSHALFSHHKDPCTWCSCSSQANVLPKNENRDWDNQYTKIGSKKSEAFIHNKNQAPLMRPPRLLFMGLWRT
jgi:hypothetical protein